MCFSLNFIDWLFLPSKGFTHIIFYFLDFWLNVIDCKTLPHSDVLNIFKIVYFSCQLYYSQMHCGFIVWEVCLPLSVYTCISICFTGCCLTFTFLFLFKIALYEMFMHHGVTNLINFRVLELYTISFFSFSHNFLLVWRVFFNSWFFYSFFFT